VVDPKMEGQVKITVIATGFDLNRAMASPAAQATKVTPVDLSAYTTARTQTEDRMVVNGSPRIARRPVLDLPKLAFTPVSDPDSASTEDASPLDVPAFMRQKN
jgi:hypothetical protein